MPPSYKLRCRLKDPSPELGKENTLNDDPPQPPKQNWRLRMKRDKPERYAKHLEANKIACRLYRLEMSMAEDMKRRRNLTEEEKKMMQILLDRKKRYNAGAKERMRKMRARKKLESQTKKQESKKPKTRLEKVKHEEKKKKWRQAKQAQRDRLTMTERKLINKNRREAYRLKKQTTSRLNEETFRLQEAEKQIAKEQQLLAEAQQKLKEQQKQLEKAKEELQQSGEDVRSATAKRKSLQRARNALPKTPSHYVNTTIELIEKSTPRKAAKFRERNVSMTKDRVFARAIMGVVAAGLSKPRNSTTRKDLASSLSSLKKDKFQRRVCRQFKVSRKLIGKAKKFQAGRKPLSPESVKVVQDFFEANSKEVPDKKLVSKRTGKPAAIVNKSIGRLYREFCDAHPTVHVGISKFHSLRPRHVKPQGTAKFIGCVCEYCANIDLKIKAVNTHLSSKQATPIKGVYNLSDITMCEKQEGQKYHNPECLKRSCADCGVHELDSFLKVLDNVTSTVHWKRWELVDQEVKGIKGDSKIVKKRVLLSKSGSMENLLTELREEAEPYPLHLFTKDWQNDQLQLLRKNLPQNSALCILDFAENYVCKHQEEAQAAYWTHESATVHPIVTYYRCKRCDDVITESIMIISDDLQHDHHAVSAFQAVAIEHLKNTRNLKLNTIYRYSDGCGSQYKSKGPISDISYGISDYGAQLHHNYSGTRHGKGASDGESAVLKSNATTAVKAGRVLIRNARELYEYAKENLTKEPSTDTCSHHLRQSFFVPSEEINRERSHRHAKQIVGTRKLHAVKTVGDGVVATRNLSCFCGPCLEGHFPQCENQLYVDPWRVVHLNKKTVSQENRTEARASQTKVNQDEQSSVPVDEAGSEHATSSEDNDANVENIRPIAELQTGSYVAIKFLEQSVVFIAMVLDVLGENLIVKFLRKRKSGSFEFTQEKDHCHPRSDVCSLLSNPMMVEEQRAFVYQFCPQEINALVQKNPSLTLK